jgi:glycosyltransferase involved in cell wall biosynthesis
MRIAFIGTRGVPATYSGFETFVEQTGRRLAGRGHDVTVYCRRHHTGVSGRRYLGMELVHVSGIRSKHLDTITHTLISCLHAAFRRYDVAVMCISGNSPLCLLLRLVGIKVVLNVDGSDWRRRKWGGTARAYIRTSEWFATRLPNITVTDSQVMRRYYFDRFGADTECIAYGGEVPPPRSTGLLHRLGLQSRRYLLLVGRLVPENCAHHLVEAYERMETDLACVVVGDAPYAVDYIRSLKARGPHVLFPGYVFGDGYRELMHNAFAVVLCSEVGGTHPVLVEAMAAGNCVIVNNTPANLEVVGDAGLSYDGERGAEALRDVLSALSNDRGRVARLRELAKRRAARYSWEAVTDRYERIFERLLGLPDPERVEPVLAAGDGVE